MAPTLKDVRSFLRGGRLWVFLGLLVVGSLLVARFATELYIDVLWFDSVGFTDVFWTRTLWQWGVRVVAGAVAVAVAYANLRVVASTLGAIQIKRRVGDLEIVEKIPRSYVFWATVAIAALVGLWFGALMPQGSGFRTLVFFRAPEWGLADPILGRDFSFYVFVLPMMRAILVYLLALVFLVAALCVAGYAATGSLGWSEEGLEMGQTGRIHLTALGGVFLVLLAVQFWFGQYGLLLEGNSAVQGIFGYADARARLPGHQVLTGLTLVCAGGLVWAGIRNRSVVAMASVATLFVGGVLLLQLYPSLVQRFQVEPNELSRESPYIEYNLGHTRVGFGLDQLQRRPFEYAGATAIPREEAMGQLDGFPVWSEGALLTTYREVEARFRYYQFPEVDFDRYPSPDGTDVVSLSVRQIDPGSIEDPNWQNLHLRRRYIAGMGAVASSATSRTPEGRPRMLLTGIPPELTGEEGIPSDLAIDRPAVFFQTRPQLYAVLNPGEGILEGPGGEPLEAGIDYPRGILLDSPFRTLALAWQYRDANLLFAAEISDQSRFVLRRQVQERVRQIAPFLEYLEAPYPVVHEGRVVWMMDGFTATRNLPLSTAHEVGGRRRVNYVRNSVKITVDAVSGGVRFYVVREDDPLLEGYSRAFPSLFRPMEEMPSGLRDHIRYPRSLLDLQATVLRQYHQETPEMFHGQQDVWSRPQELGQGSRSVPYGSEYAYYRLPGEEEPSFYLTTVFVPVGRQNLTGVLAARGDPERYGELVLLDAAVEDQVPGPRQVEALVEQDPVISEQFSLWRTGGSQVWTGHLHLVPVGESLLYIEPIFLAAAEDAIPELRRFVLSDGQSVVMTETLTEALDALLGAGMPGRRPTAGGEGAVEGEEAEGGPVSVLPAREWPAEALQLLDSAEQRLRQGDWAGFGGALDRLRTILQGASQ
ncbi:MAG: UPF0182 family protein [Longimicrobiales bacterium]|nr:UPF0182 family protein [Longimicrobiales bacterium]